MAVDMKVIRVYTWRFSVLFAGICFRFAQKHPCISGTLLSLLVLYVFFPLLFKLLIYSSPIAVWVYVSRKNIIKTEHPEAQIKKQDDPVNGGNSKWVKVDGNVLAKKRYVNFSVQNGRNDVMAKNKESADYVPGLQGKACLQDNDLNNALRESESDIVGKARNDLKMADDVFLKKHEDAETEVDYMSEASGKSEFDISGKAETQEKHAPGSNKQKEMESTKKDEKGSMDLGTSETERDRRLDSLIQKRRARKLLSMQVRNVIDIMRYRQNQIAPLVIARSTGPMNLINTLSDTDDLHMPGSAPSVLLPSRNPFDLPYDPFEERPNLTGDSSFQLEFVNGDQKDVLLGGPFEHGQDGSILNAFVKKEKKGMTRHGFSRFRSYRERSSYESLSPGASSGEHELMSRDDITVHDYRYEEQSLNQSMMLDDVPPGNHAESENMNFEVMKVECDIEPLSSEGGRSNGLVEGDSNNQVESAKAESTKNTSSEDLTSYLQKSLTSSLQESSAKDIEHHQSPLLISSKDMFNVHKRVLHTPAHSIASDLVVEVSEAGSPPPTLSPPDGDSSQHDGDVDRDLSSGSEDMSMHVNRTEDLNARCLEGHESGKDALALEESIPEAVELEQDVLDGYEHTSHTSSSDDSSYENVVQHLNEKLKSCRGGFTEFPGPAPAETNADTSVDPETSLNGSTMDSGKLDGDSSQQDHESVQESLVSFDGQGSSNVERPEIVQEGTETSSSGNVDVELPEVLQGGTESRSSGNVDVENPGVVQEGTEMRISGDVALPDTQQAQANEELPLDTSPNSVLPGTDSSDPITGSETELSDFVLPDNSIASMSENQDLKSSTSERDIEDATAKVIESEAALHSAASESKKHNGEPLVIQMSLDNQGDSLVPSVRTVTDESSGMAQKSPELNASASSIGATEEHLEQKSAKSDLKSAEVYSQDESPVQDVQTSNPPYD